MSKWKISLYLAALFLAGVVTGGFATIKYGRHMISPDVMTARWRNDLQTKLQLTPDQVQRIDPILKETMARFGAMLGDQMLISMSNCNSQIRVVLKPEQQERFNDFERQQIEFVSRFKKGKRPSE